MLEERIQSKRLMIILKQYIDMLYHVFKIDTFDATRSKIDIFYQLKVYRSGFQCKSEFSLLNPFGNARIEHSERIYADFS